MVNEAARDERLTVTVPEASRMLGIARGTGYRMCRLGTIPTLRFGKRLVVPRRAVERMLDQAEPTPTD
jgi:excisionase family DNA binding protein